MTTVLLYRLPGDVITGYRISGHTGFAPSGQDIVCSAVSFLSITCANALESVAGIAPIVLQRDGLLEVHLPQGNDRSDTIFRVFEQGMKDLEAAYPKHIRLKDSEPPK
ncbi:MAG: ribosomal-processing cysteine protease Prp [Clostridiales bacterium]|nr:ribosomal-processing cysteine protease Prp [Clostridiales bacterium]